MTLIERIQNLRKKVETSPQWYGQTFADSMTAWEVDNWEKALGCYKSPFSPTYRGATGTDGVITWPLNSTYFASEETARAMAVKYGEKDAAGTGVYYEQPFSGNGGIFASDQNEYHIKLADGRMVNAGLLAGYYDRNPEDKFPGLADILIKKVLGL